MRGLKIMVGGKILKVGRKLRGMTQAEVAAFYGVDQSTYRRWEKGEHAVSFDDVITICDHVFKMPLADIQRIANHG